MATAFVMTGPFGDAERVIQLDCPMTVAEIIEANELQFRLPTIAVMGDKPVLRAEWASRVVGANDNVAFIAVPAGGGESGGKQIVGLIAALALSVAAPMIGGWAAGAFFGGSAIAANMVSGLLAPGGSILFIGDEN